MIELAEIIRLEKGEAGTFGALKIDGQVTCVTLEPEDRNNAQGVSCIPEGDYIAKRVNSPKYGDTFEISDVPNRTHILFHAGNVENHTKGCVLLGRNFGALGKTVPSSTPDKRSRVSCWPCWKTTPSASGSRMLPGVHNGFPLCHHRIFRR